MLAKSVAPEPTVIVYNVPFDNREVGAKIIVVPLQLNDSPTGGDVEKAPSVLVRFIGSLNVTVMVVPIDTSVPVGELSVTVGEVLSSTVVNCQMYSRPEEPNPYITPFPPPMKTLPSTTAGEETAPPGMEKFQ